MNAKTNNTYFIDTLQTAVRDGKITNPRSARYQTAPMKALGNVRIASSSSKQWEMLAKYICGR